MPNSRQLLHFSIKDDQEVGTAAPLTWTPKVNGVTLEVSSDKATIEGTEEAVITVKNTSKIAVIPSDVTVLLNVDNGATFDLGTAAGKADADSLTLAELLNNVNTAIAPGATVNFGVKLNTANANGESKSELSFTMAHSGGNVAFTKKKVVEWGK